ncbi:MAG TPA: hypothetical protein VGR00_00875, partial [Thermoanaerobaculia bacterium]|nr:hypothetical protein [Thermoanaerobaculia bacterium]
MIGTFAFLLLILGASTFLGGVIGRVVPLPEGHGERAIALTAGLGASALLLAAFAAAGRLSWGFVVLGALAVPGLVLFFRRRQRTQHAPIEKAGRSFTTLASTAVVGLAALSALAPVTDPDSLAYPLPIARRLAQGDAWRFWPELWMSAFPLSHEMLLSLAVRLGATSLGLLAVFELALCAFLLDSLARRAGLDDRARGIAVLVGLGCPVIAFLAPSAKEDLLVCAAALAAAHALLALADGSSTAPAVGLFAGLAAGTKLSGIPIALAMLAAAAFVSRGPRARSLAAAGGAALAAGGIWYGANVLRFGNPVPPYFSPPLPSFLSPLSTRVALGALRWGEGRGLLDFLLAPVRMFVHADRFGSLGGLFNPLVFIGLATLVMPRTRRLRSLVVVAGGLYAAWFATDQIARLLLPAALLLAVPAGMVLSRFEELGRAAKAALAILLAVSTGSVLLVSGTRVVHWVTSPSTFFERQTPNAGEIAWMNTHLDASRHRIATTFKASDPLRIPWFDLEPVYQAVIPAELLGTGRPLLDSLRGLGVTHVFIPRGS